MGIYILTIIIVATFTFLMKQAQNKKIELFLLICLTLFLIIISGFRIDNTLYSDEWNYRYMFNQYIDIPFNSLDLNITSEPGFSVLVWVLARLFGDSQSLILICAIITNISFVKFLYTHSEDFRLTMFLYISAGYYFTSMNIMRQYLAISILLFGFKYLETTQLKKFIIFVFGAFLFHKSAFIVLIVYFIVHSKIVRQHKLISLFIVGIIMINFNSLINILENTAYGNYADTFLDSGYGVGFTRVLFWSMIFLFIIFKSKLISNKVMNYSVFFNNMVVSFSINLISLLYVYVSRLDYFSICNVILIEKIPYCFTKNSRAIVKLIIIAVFFIFGLYENWGTNYHNILF